MLFDFIAAITAGFALAGLAMIVRHLSRWRLPRWLVPLAAGAGMIGYAIWNETSWYERVTQTLPPEVTIISAPRDHYLLRPWTLIRPVTLRFLAWDGVSALQSDERAGLILGDVLVVRRWHSPQRLRVAVDCATERTALMPEGASLSPDGALSGAQWAGPEFSGALVKAACTRAF